MKNKNFESALSSLNYCINCFERIKYNKNRNIGSDDDIETDLDLIENKENIAKKLVGLLSNN